MRCVVPVFCCRSGGGSRSMVHKSLDQILFEASWGVDGATSRRSSGPQSWGNAARTTAIPEDIRESYRRASEITGPLMTPQHENAPVQFKRVATRKAQRLLVFVYCLAASASLFFLAILFWPGH